MANQELLERIMREREGAISNEQILAKLVHKGFGEEEIRGALAYIDLYNKTGRSPNPQEKIQFSGFSWSLVLPTILILASVSLIAYGFSTGSGAREMILSAQSLFVGQPFTVGSHPFIPFTSIPAPDTRVVAYPAPEVLPVTKSSDAVVVQPSVTSPPTPVTLSTRAPKPAKVPAPVVTPPPVPAPVTPTPVVPPVVVPPPVTLPPVPPSPISATATDTPSLLRAIQAAKAGDTITLAPNTYSGLGMIRDYTFATPITITSADTSNRAILTNFTLLRVNGFTFTNLEFISSQMGAFAVLTSSSQNIHFDNVDVHGSLDGDPSNDGAGLGFLDTSNLSVTDSRFEQLRQGVSDGANVTTSVSNIRISGNVMKGLAKSGIVLAGASNVTITGNSISNIRARGGDHPDAIQFFTTGTKAPAHDITVADNVIVKGVGGSETQGIFFRDQVGTLHYQNVRILNNIIVNTGYGGIYAEGIESLEVSGNLLTSDPEKTHNTFFLIQNSTTVTSTNNRAHTISFDKVTNLTQAGDATTTTVTDGGLQAMREWVIRHPASAPLLAPFIQELSYTPRTSMLASVEAAFSHIKEYLLSLWR